jgi:hypothetical protein
MNMDYSSEEIKDMIESGEAVMEDRRFSSNVPPAEVFLNDLSEEIEEERREFSSVNLNIKSIIAYMNMDLKDQFRFLIMSVKKYVSSLKPGDTANRDSVVSYISSELSRMIMMAKKQMKESGGNINSILGLNRVGSGDVMKLGTQLTKLAQKATISEEKSGTIPKVILEDIHSVYNKLVNLILEKVGIKVDKASPKVPMDSDVKVSDRVIKMSALLVDNEPHISDEEVTTDFTIENVDKNQLDEIEEFINELDAGVYEMYFDSGVLKITFHDKLNDYKLIQFKNFINEY